MTRSLGKAFWIAASCSFLGVGSPASADVILNLGPQNAAQNNTSVGSASLVVSSGGFSVTAHGYDANNTDHTLFLKNGGGDEVGLGLVGTNDHELTLTNSGHNIANYIQVDVSQVYKTFIGGKIEGGSVTNGEAYDVYGSNTAGVIGSVILSDVTTDAAFVSIPNWGTYKYISMAVHTGGSSHQNDNVLLEAITAVGPTIQAVTPEPSTIQMLGTSVFVGLGVLLVRREKFIRALSPASAGSGL